jgi:hypothetical protein
MQVACSFLLFPKPFNSIHLAGSIVIVASLCAFGGRSRGKHKESPKAVDRLHSSSESLMAWKLCASGDSMDEEDDNPESLGVGIYLQEEERL